ncbi:hypothetical protein M404DRAFT_650466 [Pisolithus tinctorius Marx 270]|uniref:Secreted protein n=1 Tax=Pisolithus tinctorius Marx 270 TaxID=870435 RepID=A0A0C3J0A0_PISTI|nr:hypothetical protein M404DRAFT_650466 [Pisolithus tinctorius Marx 270]
MCYMHLPSWCIIILTWVPLFYQPRCGTPDASNHLAVPHLYMTCRRAYLRASTCKSPKSEINHVCSYLY